MRLLLILIISFGYAAAEEHGQPYLPRLPVNGRAPLTPEQRIELGSLLITPAMFIEEFTNRGVLYHGMFEINAMDEVYRRGFWASRESGLGARDGGWGLFTSKNFGRALGHGNRIPDRHQGEAMNRSANGLDNFELREFGVIFPLTIKPSDDLRVIDLQRDRHVISSLIKRYDIAQTRFGWYDVSQLSQVLQANYGIDVVISQGRVMDHVLERSPVLMNAAMFTVPSPAEIQQFLVRMVHNADLKPVQRFYALKHLESLLRHLGNPADAPNIEDLKLDLTRAMLTQLKSATLPHDDRKEAAKLIRLDLLEEMRGLQMEGQFKLALIDLFHQSQTRDTLTLMIAFGRPVDPMMVRAVARMLGPADRSGYGKEVLEFYLAADRHETMEILIEELVANHAKNNAIGRFIGDHELTLPEAQRLGTLLKATNYNDPYLASALLSLARLPIPGGEKILADYLEHKPHQKELCEILLSESPRERVRAKENQEYYRWPPENR